MLCGLLTQIVVANCNALAAVLLLRTAAKVRQSTYEAVAEAVGGPMWRVVTQVSARGVDSGIGVSREGVGLDSVAHF